MFSKYPTWKMEGQNIAILFVVILIEVFGNLFLFGIVIYEKYGIDNMRRTVNNMLISQTCLVYIFCQITALPFWVYGFCFSDSGIGEFKYVTNKNLQ